jgi:hypothetical protein
MSNHESDRTEELLKHLNSFLPPDIDKMSEQEKYNYAIHLAEQSKKHWDRVNRTTYPGMKYTGSGE